MEKLIQMLIQVNVETKNHGLHCLMQQKLESMKESFLCQLGKTDVQVFQCVITVHADKHLLIKKDLLKLSGEDGKEDPDPSEPRRSSMDPIGRESIILPKHCIFCKKGKYKRKSKTREKTHSFMEFRADEKVKESAMLHVELCTEMSDIAKEVLGLCAKDLISSEAKYVTKCFCMFCQSPTKFLLTKTLTISEDPD